MELVEDNRQAGQGGMMFTDQQQFTVTERDVHSMWSGGKDGKYFRCYFCGHKFVPGDKARWIYTNDMDGAWGNPLVCEECDTGSNESMREKWATIWKEWRNVRDKYWFFVRHLGGEEASHE